MDEGAGGSLRKGQLTAQSGPLITLRKTILTTSQTDLMEQPWHHVMNVRTHLVSCWSLLLLSHSYREEQLETMSYVNICSHRKTY